MEARARLWPALPLAEWQDTCDTLHMWLQIVGKVRLALSPHVNHWWEVPLYLTARGLTTTPIPTRDGIFEIDVDFIEHVLAIEASWGARRSLRLVRRPVAAFYREFMDALADVGVEVRIWPHPVEVPDGIPFDLDWTHDAYDPLYANRWWRALISADTIFKEFRGRFIGKDSPVHFFWGSFDLAVTRFSGRRAPPRPGADAITREAYSHEVISAGFWPGGGDIPDAAFYCYAAPEPARFHDRMVKPDASFYDTTLREFILMYEDVRRSPDPRATLLEFLQSSYEAGASLAGWDRGALEAPR